MTNNNKDEYYLLLEILERINWALEGSCDDIDCDKYMYKNLLQKKYKPVLNHSFSCIEKLQREKEAVLRIVSQKKYDKFRLKKCPVCRKMLDTLSAKSSLVSYTRPSPNHKNYLQWDAVWVHKKCQKKVKIPSGWKKGL